VNILNTESYQTFHPGVYLDNSLWNQRLTLYCTTKISLYVHHGVCIGESIRESSDTALQW